MNSIRPALQKKDALCIIIIGVISLPAVFFLLNDKFFITDDADWMVIRFSAFYQALRDGQFPVRFLHRLNSGFGYPVATFLYPGFMYAAVPLKATGLSYLTSIKVLMVGSFLLSGIFSFYWLSHYFNRVNSSIGAILYMYLPYHLYDLYTRGSVGELFAFIFPPFILWQIERNNIWLASLGIFMLVVSHNTLALLFLSIIFIYAILKKQISAKKAFLMTGLGVSAASFFTIPAIFELKYTQFSNTPISDPLNYFTDYSMFGIPSILITIISLFVYFKSKKSQKWVAALFLFVSISGLFLSSPFSSFFWKYFPSSVIQFPYRLMSVTILSSSFLAAYTLSHLKNTKKIIFTVVLIVLGIYFLASNYPSGLVERKDDYFSTNEATTTVHDEYMPLWVRELPVQKPETKVEIEKGSGSISEIFFDNNTISFRTNMQTGGVVKINTIYWLGWKAFENEKEIPVNYQNEQGLMTLQIEKGISNIEVKFSETPLRIAANSISIFTLGLIFFFYAKEKGKERNN